MFRELRRKKQLLSEQETLRVLEEGKTGIVGVLGDDGYPYGMPMNHFYNEDDGCIYFHCGNVGYRLEALRKCDKVSFCTYDNGYVEDGHWAYHVMSVIVFGRIEIIEDAERITDIVTKLSYKFIRDDDYIQKEIRGSLHRTLLLRLKPEHMCGKHVLEA